MKLSAKQISAQIKEFWQEKSKKTQKRLIMLAAALVIITIIATVFMNLTGYVALYSGLSSSEAGQIGARLNEMGIDYRVKNNGSILVPKEMESQVLMTLASEGYPQTSLTYDLFTNNSGFMTTEYEKKQYLLFQLQNRLQDAIRTIRGVNKTIVTISIPDDNSFVLEEDKEAASASVILDLAPGVELSAGQIKGIETLVSKSVLGLDSNNVAIVSTAGDLLNTQYTSEREGLSYAKLELEKAINKDIESKITKLLTPVFGYQSIRVAVNTVVDVNKKISEQTTYIPAQENGGLIAKQDSAIESIGETGSSAGGIPGTASNSGINTYQEIDSGSGTSSSSESSSTNYLNNQLIEQIQRDGYEITDITVAVLINDKGMTDQEIDKYQQMVAYAAGISADKVIFANTLFAAANAETEKEVAPTGLFGIDPLYLGGGAAVAIGLVLFLVLKMKKKHKKQQTNEDGEGVFSERKFPGLKGLKGLQPALVTEGAPIDAMLLEKKPLVDEIVLSETREQSLKKQIKEFAAANPDIVAQLIRTWLKEDEDNE